MIKLSSFFITLFFSFFFFSFTSSSSFMNCKTLGHSGLDFIGKDYEEILAYYGLDKFSIKISRSRKSILENQMLYKDQKNKPSQLKNVHFSEIILNKSNNYPLVFHCSWRFNLKINKITDNPYECIEQKNKKDLFSLDYKGNFSLSSSFNFENSKDVKRQTLHSLFGVCMKNK